MLTRVYIDNYKCLVNFEIQFKKLQLLIGLNGSGKSSIFDVLSRLRQLLIDSTPSVDVFPTDSLTRWQSRTEQKFEVDVANEDENELYTYSLVVEHLIDKQSNRVKREELLCNTKRLFFFNEGNVQLYRDNFTTGPDFHWDWSRSGLAGVSERDDNRRLTWFKRWFMDLLCVQIDPFRVNGRSEKEIQHPDNNMQLFASWYRHLQQENPSNVAKLYEKLEKVISGFDSLPLVQYGEGVRMLMMRMRADNRRKPIDFSFSELSEGQRSLVVLYSLLYLAGKQGRTICIDEPDNFVSLREIQPWLSYLSDVCMDEDMQAILLSHHPEIINYLSPLCTSVLTRDSGPVRVRPFEEIVADDESMTPAELVVAGDVIA